MTTAELQRWLNARGQSLVVDGSCGPRTKAAICKAFTNPDAPRVTAREIEGFAIRLGCAIRQLKAVAKVESGGAAYDRTGRPKILYERHIFHRLTSGRWSKAEFSDPTPGGYRFDNWVKLTDAACKDVDAAFSAISIGRFQIMGMHWRALGYASPIDMAWTTVGGEAAHYEQLVRFIEANGLQSALRRLSVRPNDNRAFASSYNGPAFDRLGYDIRLARAMADEGAMA